MIQLTAALLTLLGTSFGLIAAEPISVGTHYVKAEVAGQRAFPEVKSPVLGNLKRDQRVMVYEIKGEWARISTYTKTMPHQDIQSAIWVRTIDLTKRKTLRASQSISSEARPALALPKTKTKEILIPRSMPGDKGKYYLLEKRISGDVIRTIHKRVGADSVGYTAAEINCGNRMIRELGYSEISVNDIRNNPTDWFELVPGSSKSDLVNFVCN